MGGGIISYSNSEINVQQLGCFRTLILDRDFKVNLVRERLNVFCMISST